MDEYRPLFENTWLAKNRTGNWCIRWTVPAEHSGQGRALTRQVSCGTKDRKEAEQFRLDWFDTHNLIAQHTSVVTVQDLIDQYVKHHCIPNNVGRSQVDSLKPVGRWLGAKDVSRLVPLDATAYRTGRLGEGVKDGTIRRELGALRRVISWSVSKQLWPKDVTPPVLDLPPDSAPRENYVTAIKEAKAYAQAAADYAEIGKIPNPNTNELERERAALFTMMALDTAARAGAIEELTLDRIDLVNGWIDYRNPDKKATRKRRTVVPIADRLRPHLTEAVRRARARGWKRLLGPVPNTAKVWASYRKHLGLPDVTRHDLRRTFATLAAQSGVGIWEVAGVLADTVATTERNYARHVPAFLRGAVNKRPVAQTEH